MLASRRGSVLGTRRLVSRALSASSASEQPGARPGGHHGVRVVELRDAGRALEQVARPDRLARAGVHEHLEARERRRGGQQDPPHAPRPRPEPGGSPPPRERARAASSHPPPSARSAAPPRRRRVRARVPHAPRAVHEQVAHPARRLGHHELGAEHRHAAERLAEAPERDAVAVAGGARLQLSGRRARLAEIDRLAGVAGARSSSAASVTTFMLVGLPHEPPLAGPRGRGLGGVRADHLHLHGHRSRVHVAHYTDANVGAGYFANDSRPELPSGHSTCSMSASPSANSPSTTG